MILDQLDAKKVESKIDESLPITDHILKKLGFTFKQTTLNTIYDSKPFNYWYYTDADGADVALECDGDMYKGKVFFPQYSDSFLAPYGPEREEIVVHNVGELKKFIEASNKAAELRKYIREKSKEIKSIVDEIIIDKNVRIVDSMDDITGGITGGEVGSISPRVYTAHGVSSFKLFPDIIDTESRL